MVKYRVLVFDTDGTSAFGIGDLLVEFDNPKNVGWERHLNEVNSAFWTIAQDDPKLTAALRSAEGAAHVQIVRETQCVFRGFLGEHDAQGDDVIFYAYSYEGYLFSLVSDWNQQWKDAQLNTIASDLWTYAKTTLTYSPVGFIGTGTIEAPVTTSGGATPIVLPLYRIYHKRILFALRDMVTIATSDTTNTVYFETAFSIVPSVETVAFNFWKNKSVEQTDVKWEYPNGIVRDFNEARLPVLARNDLYGVGSAPNDLLLRKRVQQATGTFGYEEIGRRQEPLFFSWARDEDELERVTRLRLARALRPEPDLRLRLLPNSYPPPEITTSSFPDYKVGDRIKIKVKRGMTDIDQMMFLSGVQVVASRGVEYLYPWLMDRSGS